MAYTVLTQNDLLKWWITGTGSVVNRLSEVMDDAPDGPAVYHLDADNDWTADSAPEWYVACATKPDNVSEKLVAWRNMTDAGDNQMGSLASDEWTYDTGNNRVYVQLSDDSDPNATDVRLDYDWDGAGAGPAFMTETVEDGIYQIHLQFEIGNGANATTLVSLNETVYFDDGVYFTKKALANLTLGEKHNSWGINGAFWNYSSTAEAIDLANGSGNFNLYASMLHYRGSGTPWVRSVDIEMINSQLSTEGTSPLTFHSSVSSLVFSDVYCTIGCVINVDPTASDLHFHNLESGYATTIGGAISVLGVRFTDISSQDIYAARSTSEQVVNIIDPKASLGTVKIAHADSVINEQYTINITVVDKDGTGIVGATVTCDGSDSGTASEEYDVEAFSEDTGASGVLAEQTVTAKKWTGTSETLTNYNYFKFTISKPGYETLIMEKVTIDAPVDWHVELQQPAVRRRPVYIIEEN